MPISPQELKQSADLEVPAEIYDYIDRQIKLHWNASESVARIKINHIVDRLEKLSYDNIPYPVIITWLDTIKKAYEEAGWYIVSSGINHTRFQYDDLCFISK
jgi:hypothetical protein